MAANSRFCELFEIDSTLARPGVSRSTIFAGTRSVNAAILKGQDLADQDKFEIKLDDGRWLDFNKRPTQCGGFVLVGADITARKQHDAAMLASEQQLS